jgi:DNA ligase-1
MKLQTLYKRATNGKISQWTIEMVPIEAAYRTIAGYTDGVKTTSEWTYVKGKNIGRANETTNDAQCLKEAQAIWQKKVDSGYFATVDEVDGDSFFKPMLAKDWNVYKDEVKYPIYTQPKLDGIRCIIREDGMWTRNGKPIDSAPHIFESLAPIFADQPDLIFDGELYADKFANDFNKICSLVKKTKPTKMDLEESANAIEYHIYDLPSHKGSFTERYVELMTIELPKCCVIVETNQVDNENDVLGFYQDYVNEGYEGQILRLDAKYENKRSKSLLKHKSFMDEEFVIVDVCEGEGNKAGMVGYMVFETNGVQFKSNVKANWDESKEMWKNRKSLIGKQATIKFFNYTPDGIPRFPYVIAVRDYE